MTRVLSLLSLLIMTCCQGISRSEMSFAKNPPNILIAISDDQSYPYSSAYGSQAVQTPAFDRLARMGVLFTNAFVASPGCSPSRAALLTGRHTWQLSHAGTHASSFPSHYMVFPDLLEKAGYRVGYTGKGWGPGNWEISGRTRNPAGVEYNQRTLETHPGIRNRDYASNFQDFLETNRANQPFYFWYGAHEPHRAFEEGAGVRSNKGTALVTVPPFLPDTEEVRSDLLDYAVEIEWFDRHLGKMLDLLKKRGELENTLVVVTSDNGMAFPRAKANLYEYGIHVPLAIAWPSRVTGGRVAHDLVSLIDLAPTFLEAAGVAQPSSLPMSGHSLMGLLTSEERHSRTMVFAARERHSSSRYENLGYPGRVIRTRDHLYIRNFAPRRWPAGAPQKFDDNGQLGPMHGGYHDIDASPSLTFLIEGRNGPIGRFFHLAIDKRPAEELFDIQNDPGCLENLAEREEYAEIKQELRTALENELSRTGDPHIEGKGDIYRTYPRYSPIRKFPPPGE